MSYDYVEIFAPMIRDAQMIEQLYQKIEEQLRALLSSKLVHQICENPTKRSRLQIIKERLKSKSKQQGTFGDEKLNLYVSFSNHVNSLTELGASYSRICLFVSENIHISVDQLSFTIVSICEHANAFWGTLMPRSDAVKINYILQRHELLKRNADGFYQNNDAANLITHTLFDFPDLLALPSVLQIQRYSYVFDDIRKAREIGWINYWTSSICTLNGFYNHDDHFDQNTACRETLSGGYLWLLTPEPWTIVNTTHRQRLVEAYQRFPKVGMKA